MISAGTAWRRIICTIDSSSDSSSESESETSSSDESSTTAMSNVVTRSSSRRGAGGDVGPRRPGRPSLVARPSHLAARGRSNAQTARRGSSRRGAANNVPRPVAPTQIAPTDDVAPDIPAIQTDQIQQKREPPPRLNASVNLECIVCLENLDSPATIINTTAGAPNEEVNENLIILEGSPVQRGVQAQRARGRGRGAAGSSRTRIQQANVAAIDPREIATTPCGHMYHRYCIEKWFLEQGKKTCPNCRKNLTKIIRLFPSVGQENNNRSSYGAFGGTSAAQVNNNNMSGSVTCAASTSTSNQVDGVPQPRQLPQGGCANPTCVDLQMIHGTLVGDFNSLRERHILTREDLDLKIAQMASLQESFDRLTEEATELRAQATGGRKRVRHH